MVRADRGTENVNVEMMQTFLRSANNDDRANFNTTFLYGRSTANQRIESWWSKFGSMGMSTWIAHFKDLEQMNIIDTSEDIDIQCCRYCYMYLLRRELNTVIQLWNVHYIRKSRDASAPHGKPDIMYHMPELFDSEDCLHAVNSDELNALSHLLTMDRSDACDEEYMEIFELIRIDNWIQMPNTLDESDKLLVLVAAGS